MPPRASKRSTAAGSRDTLSSAADAPDSISPTPSLTYSLSPESSRLPELRGGPQLRMGSGDSSPSPSPADAAPPSRRIRDPREAWYGQHIDGPPPGIAHRPTGPASSQQSATSIPSQYPAGLARNPRIPSVLRPAPPPPPPPPPRLGPLNPDNLPPLTYDATRNYPVPPTAQELIEAFPAQHPPLGAPSIPLLSTPPGPSSHMERPPSARIFVEQERAFFAAADLSTESSSTQQRSQGPSSLTSTTTPNPYTLPGAPQSSIGYRTGSSAPFTTRERGSGLPSSSASDTRLPRLPQEPRLQSSSHTNSTGRTVSTESQTASYTSRSSAIASTSTQPSSTRTEEEGLAEDEEMKDTPSPPEGNLVVRSTSRH